MEKLINSYLLTKHLQVVLYLGKKKYCEVLIWLESTSSHNFWTAWVSDERGLWLIWNEGFMLSTDPITVSLIYYNEVNSTLKTVDYFWLVAHPTKDHCLLSLHFHEYLLLTEAYNQMLS